MNRAYQIFTLVLLLGILGAPRGIAVQAQDCGTAPTPQLAPGYGATVLFTDGRPINVRQAPSRDGARVGQLAEGSAVQVLEGPTCTDGINWWRIEAEAVSGWIAEGLDGEYFVAPTGIERVIDLSTASPGIEDGDCGLLPSRAYGRNTYFEPAPGLTLVMPPWSTTSGPVPLRNNQWLMPYEGPVCREGNIWWTVDGDYYGQVPETLNGEYVLAPLFFDLPEPTVLGVPMTPPVISSPDVPLPAVTPDTAVVAGGFSEWSWAGADPTRLVLPTAYNGDLPTLPIDLDTVHFVADANLNDEQLALLAQNGFVVVPSTARKLDELYMDGQWTSTEGKGIYVSTDAILNALYLVYENALQYLELDQFYGRAQHWLASSYLAAEAAYQAAIGTPAEEPARRAAVYYGVALQLIGEGFDGYEGWWLEGRTANTVLRNAPDAIMADVTAIASLASAGQGVMSLPLLDDYQEDFTQYLPRGSYANSPVLSAYFRALMWTGRITFRTKSAADTQTGLFVLKALRDGGGLDSWRLMDETLAWLVGPVDDLGPIELMATAESVFGTALDAAALTDPALTQAYIDALKALPAPRINSLPLPVGITEDALDDFTRGFRVFGQRFTFDAYIFQQLIYPAVGEFTHSRVLPMGEDIAAVLGSDLAFVQTDAAGATSYVNYTENIAALRTELNGISAEAWSENLYGAWLHALQPLAVHDPALLPPYMQTDAWKYKDMNTLLASVAQLKHATILYVEQAYGGFGGGGHTPPVISTPLVEPNPLVFARVAVIARQLSDGLQQRGLTEGGQNLLYAVTWTADRLASISGTLAYIARKEIAGEPLTYEEGYFLQEEFGTELWMIRSVIEEAMSGPRPQRMGTVVDVASNPTVGSIYYMAVGDPEVIYVVANGPSGLHLTRGAVFSSYQFEGGYDRRLTDDDWRADLAEGNLPPRPVWTSMYRAD